MSWNQEELRSRFPSLAREVAGRPAVFFDGPAGSQVPTSVLDAMNRYLIEANANSGGRFETSVATDRFLDSAHRRVATFLGGDDPAEIVFGANMTTLTLALARALTRVLREGDEILLTRIEHDANFTPWVQAASEAGAVVRTIDVNQEDCTLDLSDLDELLGERTRLVAVAAASNMVGTVTPVKEIVARARAAGAWTFVDAVHYAPHRLIDVAGWGADFVTCSAYKFFGPHVGILWGRRELLEELPAYRLRPPGDTLPGRWMTGTPNHEGIAGTVAAIDHIASLAGDGDGDGDGERGQIASAFDAIREYEERLLTRMLDGLERLPAVRVWGITDRSRFDERVPTMSITHETVAPADVARHLAERGIFVWDGNYYALPLSEALGLEPDGTVRIGMLHYNTVEEVDRLLEALSEL